MRWLAPPLLALVALGCRERAPGEGPDASEPPTPGASASADEPEPDLPRAPPKGMVWIPPGVLLAGTPEGRLPRLADAEMPGAQVVMRGFFIDELPFPNEPGAIPVSNVSQPEAQELCEKQGKRLCSELEWERACKGPDNRVYPYGNEYRPSECGTGSMRPGVPPVGLQPGCRSGFGVRDLHGSVWQWTSSPWGRGSEGNLVTLRGGNGQPGEVFGRCAHASARRPTERHSTAGLRCCAGERNLAEVTINIARGEPLVLITNTEPFQRMLTQQPPAELAALLAPTRTPFKVLQTWRWHPIGNEELILQSGCAHPGPLAICGIAVHRARSDGSAEALAYASSGWWLPALHETDDPRDMFVFGGDKDGGFRRYLGYAYGRVVVGQPERNIKKKKKDKGER